MIRLSDRISALQPSATLDTKAKADRLRAAGRTVVDLSVGEPSGEPPAEAVEAAVARIRAGRNTYGPVAGLMALRTAVAEGYRGLGADVAPANVVVTCGAKHALYALAMALLQEGDEVVVPTPSWVSYEPQIELAGARQVSVPCDPQEGFQPDPARVRAAIGPRTRAILVNSPSNPTGAVATRERLAAIDDLAREHGLVVISDEIYSDFVFGGHSHTCWYSLAADAPKRAVIVSGVSKSFAMTGWRVGWMVAPEPVAKACTRLQGHLTSNISEICQAAALAALGAPPEYRARFVADLEDKRAIVSGLLGGVPGIDLGAMPGGAFYVFPRVDALFGRRTPGGQVLGSGADVAGFLLDEGGVATVPGEAFGEPRCVRLCYALARDVLVDGLGRIARAVEGLG